MDDTNNNSNNLLTKKHTLSCDHEFLAIFTPL